MVVLAEVGLQEPCALMKPQIQVELRWSVADHLYSYLNKKNRGISKVTNKTKLPCQFVLNGLTIMISQLGFV